MNLTFVADVVYLPTTNFPYGLGLSKSGDFQECNRRVGVAFL